MTEKTIGWRKQIGLLVENFLPRPALRAIDWLAGGGTVSSLRLDTPPAPLSERVFPFTFGAENHFHAANLAGGRDAAARNPYGSTFDIRCYLAAVINVLHRWPGARPENGTIIIVGRSLDANGEAAVVGMNIEDPAA